MNNTKTHTPGPFRALKSKTRITMQKNYVSSEPFHGWHIMAGENRIIALLSEFHPNAEENARLIAAAPEMLKALKLALGAYEANFPKHVGDGASCTEGRCAYCAVKCAIKKAEGA